MKIEQGGTRVIFIFSNIVVKIPKLKVIRPFIRFFHHLINRQVEEKLMAFDQTSIVKAILRYFLSGIIANRFEYYYSKKHKNFDEIIPVYGLCFGMILIQKKVQVVEEEDERWKKFLRRLVKKGIKDIDLLVARNFGWDNGRIKVLDYGRIETIREVYKLKFL
ncbi:MAG: hypothetical protein WCW04_00515 [Candidatus Paceibacterota bacterium]